MKTPKGYVSKNVIDLRAGHVGSNSAAAALTALSGHTEIHVTHAKDISGPPAPPRPRTLPPTLDAAAYAWKNSRH